MSSDAIEVLEERIEELENQVPALQKAREEREKRYFELERQKERIKIANPWDFGDEIRGIIDEQERIDKTGSLYRKAHKFKQ